MNLDTQYVLYECLTRHYKTLVPTDQEHINGLANAILQRAGANSGRQQLANKITSGDLGLSFEAVMKHYLMVFVEVIVFGAPRPGYVGGVSNVPTADRNRKDLSELENAATHARRVLWSVFPRFH